MVLIPIFTLEIIKDMIYIYHIIRIYYTDYYLRYSKPQYGELANSIVILLVQIIISIQGIYFHNKSNSIYFLILIIWILITNGYINIIKKAEFDFLGFINIKNTISTADDNVSSDDNENKGLINLWIENNFQNHL
tara:strand:- start:9636 stop:10040 length:405 start_codon:yes stop_codon:yes gene_type:complete